MGPDGEGGSIQADACRVVGDLIDSLASFTTAESRRHQSTQRANIDLSAWHAAGDNGGGEGRGGGGGLGGGGGAGGAGGSAGGETQKWHASQSQVWRPQCAFLYSD